MPDLSVILTTYNEEFKYLEKCINSILHQTFNEFEFIIILNPDEINMGYFNELKTKDDRIKLIINIKNEGVSSSRNKGIINSKSDYIALVDSDDYYACDRLELQLNYLKNNTDIDVIGSNLVLVNEDNDIIGKRLYPEKHLEIKKQFLFKMAIANPSIMVRRIDLDDVGLFNENYIKAEDLELWLRFLASKKIFHNLQNHLVYYRSKTNDNEKRGRIHYQNYFMALKKHSKNIWPFYNRIYSLIFFFLISQMPNRLLNILLNLRLVRSWKKISRV